MVRATALSMDGDDVEVRHVTFALPLSQLHLERPRQTAPKFLLSKFISWAAEQTNHAAYDRTVYECSDIAGATRNVRATRSGD